MTQPRPSVTSPARGTARHRRSSSAVSSSLLLASTLAALAAASACDGAANSVDASTPVSAHTSAVSLRIDVSPNQPPSLTVLAFRAAFSGVAATDVLGMVDPLANEAPLQDCQLRDLARAAAALVARGDAIELEELAGIAVSVSSDSFPEIRPSPRLYPDLAATIGGVVGEAGPLRLASLPQQIQVHIQTQMRGGVAATPASAPADLATVAVPATGWVRLLNGAVPRDGILIPVSSDLNLNLAPSDDTNTSIELRPYGATVALSCAVSPSTVPAGGTQVAFMVPRQALAALMLASGGTAGTSVAAGLELVRRSNKTLPLSGTRVSLEVRTSTFVELRP